MTRIVLASTSPRRHELLQGLGLEVEVRPPDADETPQRGEFPGALVERLAIEKARSVERDADELVLAADTVVVIDGRVLGKPANDTEAHRMLAMLSGRTHQVVGGFCVLRGEACHSQIVSTDVTFRTLTEDQIAHYVATGEPRDKAGAYGIQGLGGALVDSVSGSYTNVVGLPVREVLEVIDRLS